ncbi:PqqD family peptide modification chaperone [Lyngbya sp. PCC 8106]|uniref:PqqD family peptide modification chaperone n=1 Tax=Lyngbya sp. (strain PCC 8106) TaxID=313612 RepID=UPI0000EAC6F8|nr:PqqD family peptide modification chaperone [Lyngbya sp. PCC 8106]EAW38838.1 thymidylate synthase-like protein [Lyngbya sp. PCC 8106]
MEERSKVVAIPDQISTHLGGETLILHLTSGTYYGLNPVGKRIWDLIQEPKTVAEIRDTLLTEYEVDLEQCDRDLKAILQQLSEQQLIKIDDETTA